MRARMGNFSFHFRHPVNFLVVEGWYRACCYTGLPLSPPNWRGSFLRTGWHRRRGLRSESSRPAPWFGPTLEVILLGYVG